MKKKIIFTALNFPLTFFSNRNLVSSWVKPTLAYVFLKFKVFPTQSCSLLVAIILVNVPLI